MISSLELAGEGLVEEGFFEGVEGGEFFLVEGGEALGFDFVHLRFSVQALRKLDIFLPSHFEITTSPFLIEAPLTEMRFRRANWITRFNRSL